MTKYREDLPELPMRMRHLPISDKGYPVPWFVGMGEDGKPDFRYIKPNGIAQAYTDNTCWLCGHALGIYKTCVVGPMCGVNRVTSEPSSHLECAQYAARACPFLTRPLAVRNERNQLEGSMAGIGIKRNPGVCLVWATKELKAFRVNNGVLFKLGTPTQITFWREGRRATRAEVDESVASGLPLLQQYAKKDGGLAEAQLAKMCQEWTKLLDVYCPSATGASK